MSLVFMSGLLELKRSVAVSGGPLELFAQAPLEKAVDVHRVRRVAAGAATFVMAVAHSGMAALPLAL
jgi:hypothetical protein